MRLPDVSLVFIRSLVHPQNDHEAQIPIEIRRRHCNGIRPYASLGYRPPAPEVFMATIAAWAGTYDAGPSAAVELTFDLDHPIAGGPR